MAIIAVLALAGPATAQEQGDTIPPRLTLEQAIEIAFSTNPGHLQRANDIEVQDANVRRAYGQLLPTLSVSLSYGSNYSERSSGTGNLGEVIDPGRTIVSKSSSSRQSIDLGSITLFDWGNSFRRIDIAKLSRARTEIGLQQAEDALRANITRAYYNVASAERLIGVQEARLTSAENRLEQTKKRYSLGRARMSDILGVELEVAEADQAVADARSDVRSARLSLLQQLGVGGEPPFEVVTPLPDAFDPAVLDEADLIARALEQSPDVAFDAIQLDIEEKNRTNTKYQRFPSLSLDLPSYSWGQTERGLYDAWGDFLGRRSLNMSVGLSARYDLFDGWSYRATRMQQEASLADARHQDRQTRLQVETSIRNGLLDLERAYRSLRNAEARAERERQRLELTSEEYRRGVTAYTTLEQMVQSNDDAQRAVIDAQNNFLNTRISLELQIGGPLTPGG